MKRISPNGTPTPSGNVNQSSIELITQDNEMGGGSEMRKKNGAAAN